MVNRVRYGLALIIFFLFMIWPLFHIILVNSTPISSWRFFGWGMYATPNPLSTSRLKVVVLDKTQPVDVALVHASLVRLSADPKKESHCINLFRLSSEQILSRLPRQGLCRDETIAKHLDYFVHFGSSVHLGKFVNEALLEAHHAGHEALAFLSHQRLNVFLGKAYIESDVYRVQENNVQYLGTITSEGLT